MVAYVGDWADDPLIEVSYEVALRDIVEVIANRKEYYADTLDKMFESLYNRFNVTKKKVSVPITMRAIKLSNERRQIINEM